MHRRKAVPCHDFNAIELKLWSHVPITLSSVRHSIIITITHLCYLIIMSRFGSTSITVGIAWLARSEFIVHSIASPSRNFELVGQVE